MTATVYRCFDGDACLYIGATINYVSRIATHSTQAEWYPNVTHTECTEHASIAEARAVEASEIQTLRPRWNIVGRGPRTTWQLSDYVEVLLAIKGRRPHTFDPYSSDLRIARIRKEMVRRFPLAGAQVDTDLAPFVHPLTDAELGELKSTYRWLNTGRQAARGATA